MRIWFLTQRLPYAPNRGDRIRAYHILQFLRMRADVDVFSLVHDDEERSHAGQLADLASTVTTVPVPHWRNRLRALLALPTARPLTLSLLDAPALRRALSDAMRDRRPDVVLAYCSSMARFAMEEPLAQVPLVVDMVDVDSEKWRALGRSGPFPQRLVFRREARCLRAFERVALSRARITVAVNERETAALRDINPAARVAVVENGISLDSYAPSDPPMPSSAVVFCGVLDYAPNEEACLRLAEVIWPYVVRERPDARLVLVGANPTARIRSAASLDSSIEVTGSVPDVRPYLWKAALAAVPLRTARGVQNKVLEALAAGLPVVTTPVVAAGLPAAVLPGIRVVDADDAFAQQILDWLGKSPLQRRALAAAANLQPLNWARQLEPLWEAIRAATATH